MQNQIAFACVSCKKSILLDAALANVNIPCPYCRQPTEKIIPKKTPPPKQEVTELNFWQDTKPVSKGIPKKTIKQIVIIGSIALFLIILNVILFASRSSTLPIADKPTPAPLKELPAEIDAPTLAKLIKDDPHGIRWKGKVLIVTGRVQELMRLVAGTIQGELTDKLVDGLGIDLVAISGLDVTCQFHGANADRIQRFLPGDFVRLRGEIFSLNIQTIRSRTGREERRLTLTIVLCSVVP